MKKKKINLAFIGTYPEVSKIFLEITSHMENIHAIQIDASFEKAAAFAREIEPRMDAILSRGGTAEYIQNAVNIPVIYIPITPFDIVKAIHALPSGTEQIAVIHFHKNVLNIREIESLYQLQIQEYLFKDYNDIEASVHDANKRGIQVVVGGAVAAQIAEKFGMKGFAVSAGYEAVSRGIEEALQILQEKRKEQHRTAQLKAAFSALVEGIIIADENRRVVTYNPVAEKLFQRRYEVGEYLQDDVFDACCQQLYERQEQAEEIHEIRRVREEIYAVSHTPVKINGKFVGVVSRYEDVTKVQRLEQQIRKEIHAKGFVAKHTFSDIYGSSPQLRKAIDMANIYAGTNSSILIEGESGTGKEFFAQSIHNSSPRKDGPFVAVNCTSIPENLLESELFGYETGAFTGARKDGKVGLFEMAHGGTLFLDEIGEIPEQVQASLLRVLQEKEIMRVGGNRIIPIDVRIISATNRNLWKQTQEGVFRVDLFYRLNIFHLSIPPLRERTGDVKRLSEEFAKRKGIILDDHFYAAILPRLERYTWPGNVRELESAIERYGLLRTIWGETDNLEQQVDALLGGLQYTESSVSIPPEGENLREMVEELERQIILKTIEACSGNQNDAAKRLGIGKTTLWRKLQKS